MRKGAAALVLLILAAAAAVAGAAEVVVLKGGTRIELKTPWVRQGNLALLTRTDGTLLSVPVSEIDPRATAAARAARVPVRPNAAVVAPPETPGQLARVAREGPRARVKITDADVGHTSEVPAEAGKKEEEVRSGSARLEVVDYSQEKAGGNLIVKGALRNGGGTPAINARLTVSALDEKGEKIGSAEAGVSNGLVEPGATVSFTATVPVAEKFPASIRFAPHWIATAPPGPAVAPSGASPAASTASTAAAAAASAPAPIATPAAPPPTPYGRGTLFTAPAPSASTTPPADDRQGYLPGPSRPEDQPKKPN